MDVSCYELICGAGLEPILQGGRGRASGFIMRMMAENKLKHTGQYKKPTTPLSDKSKMNAPVPFEYNKLANGAQSGTNKRAYGASPFIQKYFKDGTVPFTKGNTAKETEAQKKAREEEFGKAQKRVERATPPNPEQMAKVSSVPPPPPKSVEPEPEPEPEVKEELLSEGVKENSIWATYGAFYEGFIKAHLKALKAEFYSDSNWNILHRNNFEWHDGFFENFMNGPEAYSLHASDMGRGGKGSKELYKQFLMKFLGYKVEEIKEFLYGDVFVGTLQNKGRKDSFWWYKDRTATGNADYKKRKDEVYEKMRMFGLSLNLRLIGEKNGAIESHDNVEFDFYNGEAWSKKVGSRLLYMTDYKTEEGLESAVDISYMFYRNYSGLGNHKQFTQSVSKKGDKWVLGGSAKIVMEEAFKDKVYQKAIDEQKEVIAESDETWNILEPENPPDREAYAVLEKESAKIKEMTDKVVKTNSKDVYKNREANIRGFLAKETTMTLAKLTEELRKIGDVGADGKALSRGTLSPIVAKIRKEMKGSGEVQMCGV